MSNLSQKRIRIYDPAQSVIFFKTKDKWGELSNMAPGFPIQVNGESFRTVEALYQSCRFPHHPDIQQKIIEEYSPIRAKMISRKYTTFSRPDWLLIRVRIMKWCLRLKLFYHFTSFREILLSTENKSIVEKSKKDDFWGALEQEDGSYQGVNALGRLLMEIREDICKTNISYPLLPPLPRVENFLLLKHPISGK